MSLKQLIFESIIKIKFPVISKFKISEALLRYMFVLLLKIDKLNHAAVISKYPPPPSLRMWSAEIYPCYQLNK